MSLVAPTIAVTPKSGAACGKLGKKASASGQSFICVKSGKRLIWRKVASKPAPKPTVSVSPTPSPESSPSPSPAVSPTSSPSPSLTPSPTPLLPTQKELESVSFKGVMQYGIRDGMLTRISDMGATHETDSRDASEFSEVRQRAFRTLNATPRSTLHPNVEFIYHIRPEFPSYLVEFSKRELSEAASLWNDFFDRKIQVDVYLVTEKDREYIKSNRWLQGNLPNVFDRFDSKRERPFISGGGGYWNTDGRWSGNIFLATASYLNLNYVNYEWAQVAKHEFVHVAQDYGFYGNLKERNWNELQVVQPQHFREGAGNSISYLTAFRNIGWSADAMDWLVWQRARYSQNWIKINSQEDVIKMMRATELNKPDPAFEMSYAIGALMYEWFIYEYGFDAFKKYIKATKDAVNFDSALMSAIGIGKEEFYKRSAPYVYSVFQRIQPYGN